MIASSSLREAAAEVLQRRGGLLPLLWDRGCGERRWAER